MIRDIRQHKFDYSLLAFLAIIFLYFFFRFQSSPRLMFFSVVFFSFTYVIWGIYHHLRLGDCRFKIVLEYVLLAGLAIALATTLLI